jgi:hypothetical protein
MEFRSAQFRTALRNPSLFVAEAEKLGVIQEGGNPQGPLLDACLRRYFREGKSAEAAFTHLSRQMRNSTSTMRGANEAAVRSMLITFVAWDRPEGDPVEFFPHPQMSMIGSHRVSLSPALRYPLGQGYLIRHIWTQSDFSLKRPYTRLVAAGYMAHVEARLGQRAVRQVEFWHLRTRQTAAWRADDLRGALPELIGVLDRVAQQIAGPDAPAAA